MMFPLASRAIPFGLPLSVCGICHDLRNLPSDENFCTRPVISTTYKLSCRSQMRERGLLNSPEPAPLEPITWAEEKNLLFSVTLLVSEAESQPHIDANANNASPNLPRRLSRLSIPHRIKGR